MLLERGLHVDHTTIYCWVQQYAPALERRCRPHLTGTNDLWRVDETYVKVKKVWMVSLSSGRCAISNTLDCWLSTTRDSEAAKRLFHKALIASHTVTPRVINVDNNAAYPNALKQLKAEGIVPASCEVRAKSNTSTTALNKTIASSSD